VDQTKQYFFQEHSAPPSGDQNFKHPYLGNRQTKFIFLFLLDFCSDVPESFLSSQSHKPFESVSNQSHLKNFRVRFESWLGRVESERKANDNL